MSSGNLMQTQRPDLFRWNSVLAPDDYVQATYHVVAHCDAQAAAMAMAMEQSASTVAIAGYVTPDQVAAWTIRVVAVTPGQHPDTTGVRCYGLATEVYPEQSQPRSLCVVLAIPKRLLQHSYVQWLNVLVGELPRLGFLSAIRLVQVSGVEDWGPGPAFGIAGIRDRLGVATGPILCRSMRPAVGMDTATMVRLNEAVWRGGFHAVKDDELMVFESDDAFEQHVSAMVACRDGVRQASGERKAYLATLICEPRQFERRWSICCQYDVDGVLLAPFIQGVGVLAEVAARQTIPILAHNTGAESVTRHPSWGVSEAVWNGLMRHAGADWLVTSGGFGEHIPPLADEGEALQAMADPRGQRHVMPILQGGKHPDGLQHYRACVGSDDYLLIVASWGDGHPQGLVAGARAFRQAVDAGLSAPIASIEQKSE